MIEKDAALALQVVRFCVGQSEFAIDVMSVAEVLVPSAISAVPGQPDFMDGLAHLRGEYHPVMDLRRRFGLRSEKPVPKFVVVRCKSRNLVLVVDRVGEVTQIPASALREAPVRSDLGGPRSVDSLAELGDVMVMLLNTDQLLSDSEFSLMRELCQ